MTIPILHRRRHADSGPRRKPLFAHTGSRGCGRRRTPRDPNFTPAHAAAPNPPSETPRPVFVDPHATEEWAPVWTEHAA